LAPHFLQNLAVSSTCAPHCVQNLAIGFSESGQN
jgi:hypothetical protein